MTPMLHTSIAFPYGFLLKTSGANNGEMSSPKEEWVWLTNITWRPTGGPQLIHLTLFYGLTETKITDHDL